MKKQKKKTPRQLITEENLDLWSLCVKKNARNICFICKKKYTVSGLDAHHIFTKGSSKNLKYNLNNGVCLCKGCHRFKVHIQVYPELIPDLIASRGEAWFNELNIKKHKPTIHRKMNDLKVINKTLKIYLNKEKKHEDYRSIEADQKFTEKV